MTTNSNSSSSSSNNNRRDCCRPSRTPTRAAPTRTGRGAWNGRAGGGSGGRRRRRRRAGPAAAAGAPPRAAARGQTRSRTPAAASTCCIGQTGKNFLEPFLSTLAVINENDCRKASSLIFHLKKDINFRLFRSYSILSPSPRPPDEAIGVEGKGAGNQQSQVSRRAILHSAVILRYYDNLSLFPSSTLSKYPKFTPATLANNQ